MPGGARTAGYTSGFLSLLWKRESARPFVRATGIPTGQGVASLLRGPRQPRCVPCVPTLGISRPSAYPNIATCPPHCTAVFYLPTIFPLTSTNPFQNTALEGSFNSCSRSIVLSHFTTWPRSIRAARVCTSGRPTLTSVPFLFFLFLFRFVSVPLVHEARTLLVEHYHTHGRIPSGQREILKRHKGRARICIKG